MISISRRAALTTALVAIATGGCTGEGVGARTPNDGAKHELVSNPAPALALESVNGKGRVDISHLKGKVVLVDFWATWCEPCKKSFPKLEELRIKYESAGLVIVGVSEDDDGDGIKAFGATYGAKFPLVWDKDKTVAGRWKPTTMPTSFLIDKNGIIRIVEAGFVDGGEKEIEKELKSLL